MLIQILNGLVYGGLLYIVSVGLILIFGLRRVVNFAHGGFYMLGAYVGYAAAMLFGFWGGLVAAVVILGLIGILLDYGVFRPLQNADHMVTVLVTFGILLVFEDFVHMIWGADTLSVAAPWPLQGTVQLGEISFPVYRLFVVAVAVAVAAGLTLWLKLGRSGLYVRASSVDALTTGMQGVNTERLSLSVVGLGTALAGLSGVIASPLLALSPSMGSTILIESFIVVVTGGLGSFAGAFVAAMVIGQVHNMGIVYLPDVSSMLPLLLMVAVLILRPGGFARSGA
ncbi:branched-chain amino acid ABC transporter permease [Neotabrizicola sp. VNH66]|uniref:branched-chain amino acid ABC transporter permease n=1 Tax=Neotabrizicola sp. VNH66 TaxID=3400918 RepID=UPI003C00B230